MRRSKSYEVRDPMNIWNKYDFAMSGLGKKSKILAKIKHFFKCVKWSKQRITRGYCDCDVWEMFSFLQTLISDMLQTLKDTRTGSPGYLGENYTNENGILVNDLLKIFRNGLNELTALDKKSLLTAVTEVIY